jgi:integrase
MAGTVRKRNWTTDKGEQKTAWLADYFDPPGFMRNRGSAPLAARLRASDACLRPKYTLYALRHFFASVMIGLGYTSKWLQVTMGHENIALTLGTYGHLFPDRDGDRARRAAFEAAVRGAASTKPGPR